MLFNKYTLIIGLVAAFAAMGGAVNAGKTRGIRNNNPGNIRWDGVTNWKGQTGADDAGFIQFDAPEFGIRAMTRVLQSYQKRDIVKLGDIVSTWAPSVENDTESYIRSVEKRTGWARDDVMFTQNYPALIDAIIYHENGSQPYELAIIQTGIALA